MTEELEGQAADAGTVEETPVEGMPPKGAIYDGPIEKFKGKTAAQIAQSYSELESVYGKTTSELSDTKAKATAYEQWYQQQQQQVQQPQQASQPTEPPDIYENPMGAVQSYAKPLIHQEMEKWEIKRSFNDANQAKYMAKQMYPAVFDGVDDKALDQIMFSGAQASVMGKGGIHHTALRDPAAWRMAAWQMRGEQLGYKTSGPGPMDTPTTEQPSRGRAEGESPRLTRSAEESRRLVTETGTLSNKEAQEVWEQTLKDIAEGRGE